MTVGIFVNNKEQAIHAGVVLHLCDNIHPNNQNLNSIRTETMPDVSVLFTLPGNSAVNICLISLQINQLTKDKEM